MTETAQIGFAMDCPARHLPTKSHEDDAGADIRAWLPNGGVEIPPGRRIIVPTGLRPAIPSGLEIQIRSRSGLAAKHGVAVLNAPGTVDAGFRGEIMVILVNHGEMPFTITSGDRIAQIVVAPVHPATFACLPALPHADTARGEAGFGSTGTA